MLSLLRWVGDIFILVGLVGNKQRAAFVFSVIGELLWIAVAYAVGDWALVAICTIFAGMAIRSYRRWA